MENLEKSIYKNHYLNIIENCKSAEISLDSACIKLSANRISHKVTAKDPNKIYYWVNGYNIEGIIIK